MKIGDTLYLKLTMDGNLMKGANDLKTCRVIAVNEKHRHFTVEFEYPSGKIRETYKTEAAK